MSVVWVEGSLSFELVYTNTSSYISKTVFKHPVEWISMLALVSVRARLTDVLWR